MKILHLSTSDRGGAGIAAVRLHQALLQDKVDSKLLTLYKHEDNISNHYVVSKLDYSIIPFFQKFIFFVNKIGNRFGFNTNYYNKFSKKYLAGKPKGFEFFSFPVSEYNLEKHPLVLEADIIHLHWVSDGFLDYHRFFKKINKRIVWTLHDMNPFTGGCHHSDDCLGYLLNCVGCPQMKGTLDEEIPQQMFSLKMDAFRNMVENRVTIICPSQWLLNCSKSSKLLKPFLHENIHNVIDKDSYFYSNKLIYRKELGLATDKRIVLYVAHHVNNSRKGVRYLIEAFSLLKTENVILCSVGFIAEEFKNNLSIIQLGYIMDNEIMRKIYNAADVFVLPSIAENFPNTVVESLLCGTPVIAFNVGGISEQINLDNGILVDQMDAIGLAKNIDTYFENSAKYNSKNIAEKAGELYSKSLIIEKHVNVYKRMMNA